MVTRETIIRATLRFSIDRRFNTRYALFPQVKSTSGSATFNGSKTQHRDLKGSAGEVEVEFEVAGVSDNDQLALPIKLKFVLTQYFSPTEGVVIAETGYFDYPIEYLTK